MGAEDLWQLKPPGCLRICDLAFAMGAKKVSTAESKKEVSLRRENISTVIKLGNTVDIRIVCHKMFFTIINNWRVGVDRDDYVLS